MLGPLWWSMPKITRLDAKLSEIYEQNQWHLFSRQCNLQFLSTKVLQGSVAMRVNYGRIFIDSFTANLLQSVTVKKFWKSVSISQSYRQKESGTFFPDSVYIQNTGEICHWEKKFSIFVFQCLCATAHPLSKNSGYAQEKWLCFMMFNVNVEFNQKFLRLTDVSERERD